MNLKVKPKRNKRRKLEINNLNFSYGERIIFQNLQLQVFSGDKVIIVGENGVGKTTLLKLIKGSDYIFSGSIKVEGNIGYLPQSFANLPERTVFEHLIRETN